MYAYMRPRQGMCPHRPGRRRPAAPPPPPPPPARSARARPARRGRNLKRWIDPVEPACAWYLFGCGRARACSPLRAVRPGLRRCLAGGREGSGSARQRQGLSRCREGSGSARRRRCLRRDGQWERSGRQRQRLTRRVGLKRWINPCLIQLRVISFGCARLSAAGTKEEDPPPVESTCMPSLWWRGTLPARRRTRGGPRARRRARRSRPAGRPPPECEVIRAGSRRATRFAPQSEVM